VISPPTCFKVLNPDDTQKRRRKEMFDKFRTYGERVAAEIHPSLFSLKAIPG
jgi:hypothetical protein